MGRWPDPADTPCDIARQIAIAWRDFALSVVTGRITLDDARQRCAAMDRVARELRQYWIAPEAETAVEEYCTTERAAELMGVQESTIRGWISKNWIPIYRYPAGIKVDELLEYRATRRRRRGTRRVAR